MGSRCGMETEVPIGSTGSAAKPHSIGDVMEMVKHVTVMMNDAMNNIDVNQNVKEGLEYMMKASSLMMESLKLLEIVVCTIDSATTTTPVAPPSRARTVSEIDFHVDMLVSNAEDINDGGNKRKFKANTNDEVSYVEVVSDTEDEDDTDTKKLRRTLPALCLDNDFCDAQPLFPSHWTDPPSSSKTNQPLPVLPMCSAEYNVIGTMTKVTTHYF